MEENPKNFRIFPKDWNEKTQNLFKIGIMKNGRKSKESQDISERLEGKNPKSIQNYSKWKKIIIFQDIPERPILLPKKQKIYNLEL